MSREGTLLSRFQFSKEVMTVCDTCSSHPPETTAPDTPVRVKLANYDAVLLNSSGGKDSHTMLRVMVQMARDQHYPLDKLVVVHADLGPRVEWDGTTELAREQADHYGLRFVVVRHPKGDLLDYVRRRAAALKAKGSSASPWPSSGCRWCTSDLKRGPVATVMTRLTNEVRAAGVRRRVRLLNCLGLRAAESPARSKLKPLKLDKAQTNGRRAVHTYLPLFHWSLQVIRSAVCQWRTGPRVV